LRERCGSGFEDAAQHSIPGRHFIVAEAQDPETLARKPGVTDGICLWIVKGTIRLDDQTSAKASEVRHIRPNRNLPPELEAIEPPVAQEFPQAAFTRRLRLSQ